MTPVYRFPRPAFLWRALRALVDWLDERVPDPECRALVEELEKDPVETERLATRVLAHILGRWPTAGEVAAWRTSKRQDLSGRRLPS